MHDDILLKNGINSIQSNGAPDGQPSSPMFTALRPFDEELEEIPSYLKAKKKYKKEIAISKPMSDLRPLDYKDGRYMDRSFIRYCRGNLEETILMSKYFRLNFFSISECELQCYPIPKNYAMVMKLLDLLQPI